MNSYRYTNPEQNVQPRSKHSLVQQGRLASSSIARSISEHLVPEAVPAFSFRSRSQGHQSLCIVRHHCVSKHALKAHKVGDVYVVVLEPAEVGQQKRQISAKCEEPRIEKSSVQEPLQDDRPGLLVTEEAAERCYLGSS